MSEEIKEILDKIEVNELKHNKWYCSVEKDNMQKILDCITSLQQKVEQLEKENKELKSSITMEEYVRQVNLNIELSEKIKQSEKDIKVLLKENENKEKLIIQLENIRKEAIEKVKDMRKKFKQYEHIGTAYDDDLYYDDLLNILNKGSNNEKSND